MQAILVPLINLTLSIECLRVSEHLLLRKVTQSELTRWTADDNASRLVGEAEQTRLSHVVEQHYRDLKEPLHKAEGPGEDLYTLLALLDLRMPERLRCPFMDWSDESSPTEHCIFEIPDALPAWARSIHVTLNVDAETLSAYWAMVIRASDRGRRLRRALGRAMSARSMHFAEEVILGSTIGLECLFSPDTDRDEPANNTNIVVASACEMLVDPEAFIMPEVADARFESLKSLYRVRSAIVHGKEVRGVMTEAVEHLLEVLRRCVGVALELGVDELGTTTLFDRYTNRLTPELAAKIATRPR